MPGSRRIPSATTHGIPPRTVEQDRAAWDAFCHAYTTRVLETVHAMATDRGVEDTITEVQDRATAASNLATPRPPSTVFWHLLVPGNPSCDTTQPAIDRLLHRIIPTWLRMKVICRVYGVETLHPDPAAIQQDAIRVCESFRTAFVDGPSADFFSRYISVLTGAAETAITTPDPTFVLFDPPETREHQLLIPPSVEQHLSAKTRTMLKFHLALTSLRLAFVHALTASSALSEYTPIPDLPLPSAHRIGRYYRLAQDAVANCLPHQDAITTLANEIFEQYRGDEGFRRHHGLFSQ